MAPGRNAICQGLFFPVNSRCRPSHHTTLAAIIFFFFLNLSVPNTQVTSSTRHHSNHARFETLLFTPAERQFPALAFTLLETTHHAHRPPAERLILRPAAPAPVCCIQSPEFRVQNPTVNRPGLPLLDWLKLNQRHRDSLRHTLLSRNGSIDSIGKPPAISYPQLHCAGFTKSTGAGCVRIITPSLHHDKA